MSKFQHTRDNVLDDSERAASARKCLKILTPAPLMSTRDADFYDAQVVAARNIRYAPSEPQLQWLRDLVERYVTG